MTELFVKKRDGRTAKFDKQKIQAAVLSAFMDVDGIINDYAIEKANNIANYIRNIAEERESPLTVEDIGDYTEKGLMSSKRKDVAKAYIMYREERTRNRGNSIDKTINDFLGGESEYWNNENSNKNAKVVTTQRDYLAGIVSTDYSRRKILPKEVCDAHDAGIIHQHDMDYLAQNALTNCSLINLEDMLQNGTIINGVMIEPQHRLLTATTVTTQIITAVASSQYGE